MPSNERKPAPGRHNVPLYVMIPPAERARLEAFAARIGRPLSWTVRDALRVYLDATEKHAAALGRLRAELAAPGLDPERIGRTRQNKWGRARKSDKGR